MIGTETVISASFSNLLHIEENCEPIKTTLIEVIGHLFKDVPRDE